MIRIRNGCALIAFVFFSLLVTSPYHSQSYHSKSLINNLVQDSPSVQPSADYTGRSNFFFALTLAAIVTLNLIHRKKRRKI